jgi:hypothetical protein
MGIRGSSPGVKWLGHEAGLLPPSSGKVKNEWNCASLLFDLFLIHGVSTYAICYIMSGSTSIRNKVTLMP